MLQNPSKYHPNPFSHFLALHNSTNHHQQSNQNLPNYNNHHHVLTTTSHLSNSNGIVNTSLDVGKSFTIAAILGLQKNAIEQHQSAQRDISSVINLSLNDHHIINQKNHIHNNIDYNSIGNINTNNNINNSNNNKYTNSNNSIRISLKNNNFDCDNVVSRYLPNSSVGITNTNGVVNGGQIRIATNHLGSANTNSNTPSALQSLQQLHKQHAQQQAANLGYQNDKIKIDHITTKKSSLKSKRVRTIFTPEQLERLEAEFERQQYMVGPERLYLAHTLQLTEAQVKVWFQNRRIKWRKHHLEITQQRLAMIRQTKLPKSEHIVSDNSILTNSNLINERANNLLNTNDSQTINLLPTNQSNQSDSDLSICNDSIDGESILDGDD